MFSFFGGSTRRINLDNLKSGVIKADYYDPTINRTFGELCDHYQVIADPARVTSPKDKGKIERLVPSARELWKRLNALYPDASLDEINEHALTWCRDEYGRMPHGTTRFRPTEALETIERPALRALPAEPYVPASWSTTVVHPDQFITHKGKQYGLPAQYIGKRVAVRATETLVTIFFDHVKVRTYVIPEGRRAYLKDDFPAYAQPFVPGSYAEWLIAKANAVSAQAGQYIRAMIESGGNLALRRAQGCLELIELNKNLPGLSHVLGQAIAQRVYVPKRLRILFDIEANQNLLPFPVSEMGKAMTRDASYYARPQTTP